MYPQRADLSVMTNFSPLLLKTPESATFGPLNGERMAKFCETSLPCLLTSLTRIFNISNSQIVPDTPTKQFF